MISGACADVAKMEGIGVGVVGVLVVRGSIIRAVVRGIRMASQTGCGVFMVFSGGRR